MLNLLSISLCILCCIYNNIWKIIIIYLMFVLNIIFIPSAEAACERRFRNGLLRSYSCNYHANMHNSRNNKFCTLNRLFVCRQAVVVFYYRNRNINIDGEKHYKTLGSIYLINGKSNSYMNDNDIVCCLQNRPFYCITSVRNRFAFLKSSYLFIFIGYFKAHERGKQEK